jgi:integrase
LQEFFMDSSHQGFTVVFARPLPSTSADTVVGYVLLASAGMRVSEALALETKHFGNNGRTIVVEQQVEKDASRIVRHLKTDAAKREIDLHPDIAEYLRKYMAGKKGLLFKTTKNTPHLNGNLETRWLTPRLEKMGLDGRLQPRGPFHLMGPLSRDKKFKIENSSRLKSSINAAFWALNRLRG